MEGCTPFKFAEEFQSLRGGSGPVSSFVAKYRENMTKYTSNTLIPISTDIYGRIMMSHNVSGTDQYSSVRLGNGVYELNILSDGSMPVTMSVSGLATWMKQDEQTSVLIDLRALSVNQLGQLASILATEIVIAEAVSGVSDKMDLLAKEDTLALILTKLSDLATEATLQNTNSTVVDILESVSGISGQLSTLAQEVTQVGILNTETDIYETVSGISDTVDFIASTFNRKKLILEAQDREQSISYADFGTKDQRITRIDYVSPSVGTGAGFTARKTISYTLVGNKYRRDTITWSLI